MSFSTFQNRYADEIGADPFEANVHSFIIRIWLEATAEESGRATWRGHITHVPNGERRYVQDVDEITAFVIPYLEGMGVKFGIRQRLRQSLSQCRLFSRRLG